MALLRSAKFVGLRAINMSLLRSEDQTAKALKIKERSAKCKEPGAKSQAQRASAEVPRRKGLDCYTRSAFQELAVSCFAFEITIVNNDFTA